MILICSLKHSAGSIEEADDVNDDGDDAKDDKTFINTYRNIAIGPGGGHVMSHRFDSQC